MKRLIRIVASLLHLHRRVKSDWDGTEEERQAYESYSAVLAKR